MKPNTQTAMHSLIEQVRQEFPFAVPEAEICSGICRGCSKKLLEIVDSELCYWESQLSMQQTPTLGEVSHLAKLCHKVHRVLKRNNLVGS